MSGKKEMYSPEENKKLSELVKKYEAAVLNPSTTKASNDSKNKAWERITEEFNETNEIMRTTESLRVRFKKIKSNQRSQNNQDQQEGNYLALAKEESPDLLMSQNGLILDGGRSNVKMENNMTVETLIDDDNNLMEFDLLDTSDSDAYTYHLNLPDNSTSDHLTVPLPASEPSNQSNPIDSMKHLTKRKRDHTHIAENSKFDERNTSTRRASIMLNFMKHQSATEENQSSISNVHVEREDGVVAPESFRVIQTASVGQTNLSNVDYNNNGNNKETRDVIRFPFNFVHNQHDTCVATSNAATNSNNHMTDILMEQKLKIKENKLKLLESLQQQVKFDMEMKQKQLELGEAMKKKELDFIIELKQKQFDFDMESKHKQLEFDEVTKKKEIELKLKQFETDEALKTMDMEIKRLKLDNLKLDNEVKRNCDQNGFNNNN